MYFAFSFAYLALFIIVTRRDQLDKSVFLCRGPNLHDTTTFQLHTSVRPFPVVHVEIFCILFLVDAAPNQDIVRWIARDALILSS